MKDDNEARNNVIMFLPLTTPSRFFCVFKNRLSWLFFVSQLEDGCC